MRIEGKVVIITGASAGIGAACAAEFTRRGAKVSLTARSEDGMRRASPGALITLGDLTDESVRQAVVERTLERYGAIDILINNAGVGSYRPAWKGPLGTARALMELNYFAPLGLIQAVVPHMCARGAGWIVNVASIAAQACLPWLTLYSASKSALAGLTEGLRMELRRDGIKTMLVCPGYVQTGFQKNALEGEPPSAVARARRFAVTPAECAADIVRGLEREARTVVTPPAAWLLVAAARLLPSTLEARLAKMNGTA